MLIVGISGLAGSGKDTFANFIEKEVLSKKSNVLVRYLPFAKRLKETASTLVGEEIDKNKTYELDKNNPITGRVILQKLGTEFGRGVLGSEVWVNLWKQQIEEYKKEANEKGKLLLILTTDVRFDNEAFIIQQWNGFVFVVERKGVDKMEHSSESGVSNLIVDDVVENSGSLVGLESLTKEIVETKILPRL